MSFRNFATSNFTAKELEAVQLVCSGLTYKETAFRLNISSKALEHRLHRVYLLLGINSCVQLTHWALNTGLIKNNFDGLQSI